MTAVFSRSSAEPSFARVHAMFSRAKPAPSLPKACPRVTAHLTSRRKNAVKSSG